MASQAAALPTTPTTRPPNTKPSSLIASSSSSTGLSSRIASSLPCSTRVIDYKDFDLIVFKDYLLHFIAATAVTMTLDVHKGPKRMAEDFSALGLRHVGSGFPPTCSALSSQAASRWMLPGGP